MRKMGFDRHRAAAQKALGDVRLGSGVVETHSPMHRQVVDWAARYPGVIFRCGPSDKEVALTFDDGPDREWSTQILDALARRRVKATFFCLGKAVAAGPDVFRRMVREGHVVGNHSWSHPLMPRLNPQAIRTEITRTNDTCRRIGEVSPALLRPPYGGVSEAVVHEAVRLKMKIVLWNVDSLDWKGLSAYQVTSNILQAARPGSIILQHSAGGPGENLMGTVKSLPLVIEELEKKGYRFVTVDRLLHVPAYHK